VTNISNRRYSSVDKGGTPLDGGRAGQGGNPISTVTAVTALRRDGEDITDHELVARVRGGDERAFELLYTRYHRRIASYIQGMVHDHARAEDIAQDVFMSALRRMRETDRTIAFKPWIYEIAKNACIDQFRRARRAEEVSMDADDGLGSADYGRLVSSTPTPDVAHDHKQQIDHLRGAFGGLSETHHEILVMRELEGLSYREIGEKLGMTRPAVESTLFRARRRLTEEYDELVTGERCVRVQQIIAAADGSALGARDKRRVARHVSYCQPCLRHARVSGLDAGDLVHKPVRAKIAAFLPLPAFLKERWGAGTDAHASFATWSAQATNVDPGMVSTWGKAAATAATIALAGVSAGVATNESPALRGTLGGMSLQSITGTDNPGGVSAADQRAGSPRSGAGKGARAGAADRKASAGHNAKTHGAAARGGTTTTATKAAGDDATGGGAQASSGGDATLAGVSSGDAGGDKAAGADGANGGAGNLLPGLDGSTAGGGGSGTPTGGGSGDSSGAVSNVAPPEVPQVEVPASSDSGDPVDAIGDKSAEVIKGVTGG
jgi:RNA polymerase sigma factor (sigma-70 family)